MEQRQDNTPWQVFRIFLRLGLTSFGGPIAHLGYFRREFVQRRQWLNEQAYADLLALCQFLPGPTSSQVGFALGLSRRGLSTALAAWLGFTLPSALLMLLFAGLATALTGPFATAAIHGLKIVAVAVVAQALWGMTRSLTPDLARIAIAVSAALLVSFVSGSFGQLLTIAVGALAGLVACRSVTATAAAPLGVTISRRMAIACLVLFAIPLAIGPLFSSASHAAAVFWAFYRSGALVFGGGHVVLPLLHDAVVRPGWLSPASFLTGYGAAQAVPGPLFTIAAYMGAALNASPNGPLGAVLALAAIFLPGLLLVMGALPFWEDLRRRPELQATMRGINAAVVGILAAALYSPLWTSAIANWRDAALAATSFALLVFAELPSWIIVIGMVAASSLLAVS
jgi:chromate transporter